MTKDKLEQRLRRNRKTAGIRHMLRETILSPSDFIYPIFIQEGVDLETEVPTMPGCYRYSIDRVGDICQKVVDLGISGIALFPLVSDDKKDAMATESLNPDNLVCRAIRDIKATFPDLLVISDIALDPYSSDGHDGIVENGQVLNDETVRILEKMALLHAEAGVDMVAPSDMMDGRIGAIRRYLDKHNKETISILSYAVKYASGLYGPFRDALESAPKAGDKKTYQMDPRNRLEARREVALDLEEGADIIMVKPGGFYLDIIRDLRDRVDCPIAAYQVSGEYAMIKAAAEQNMIDNITVLEESLIALKRAGADIIFTYAAIEVSEYLQNA